MKMQFELEMGYIWYPLGFVPRSRDWKLLHGNDHDDGPLHRPDTLALRRLAPSPTPLDATPSACSLPAPRRQLWGSPAEPSRDEKRTDIKKIVILGAGPILIPQACEFDKSRRHTCNVLRDEGYEVVLVNSKSATVMTNPGLADRSYVGPMTPEPLEHIIDDASPDPLHPATGGQTALNLAVALAESVKVEAIKATENRELFKRAMDCIGFKTSPSGIGTTIEECFAIADEIGSFLLIIRPAFNIVGSGGGIA